MNIYFPSIAIQNVLQRFFVDPKHYHTNQCLMHAINLRPMFQPCVEKNVMQVVPLHRYPEYIDQCCELVNSEWKRSKTARLRSLESSCDQLPTNMIMLQDDTVIGHSKLSVIPSIKDACFLESVVIDKMLRGKGHGTYLMQKIEEHCRSIGLKTIFLSTKDKVSFYSKLGYVTCEPVSIYGQYLKNLAATMSPKSPQTAKEPEAPKPDSTKSLPPPPPLPPDLYVGSDCNHKVFMSKVLH